MSNLNERVAREVMGWLPDEGKIWDEDGVRSMEPCWMYPEEIKIGKNGRTRFAGWACECEFSTDIAAAWLVVERMPELGFWMMILQDADGFLVKLFSRLTGNMLFEKRAKTAPEAICLAALSAVEQG